MLFGADIPVVSPPCPAVDLTGFRASTPRAIARIMDARGRFYAPLRPLSVLHHALHFSTQEHPYHCTYSYLSPRLKTDETGVGPWQLLGSVPRILAPEDAKLDASARVKSARL